MWIKATAISSRAVANVAKQVRITSIQHLTHRELVSYQNVTKPDPVAPAQSLVSSDVKTPVKLRMEAEAPGNYPPILVQTMVRNVIDQCGDRPALSIKRDGVWKTWTYSEYYNNIKDVAKGFLALGLTRHHGVGIMGANTPEWFMSSVGTIFAGGLTCGIYTTSSTETVAYICQNSPIDILVLEDGAMLESHLRGRGIGDVFPNVKKVILMNGNDDKANPDLLSWQQLLKLGQDQPDSILDEIETQQVVNEACMLVYTSGTTGPPKGTMLSHDNITYTSRIAMEGYNWDREELISYLPLSHIAAHMIDCYMNMVSGGRTSFADKDALKGTLVDNLKEIRPTKFFGVPRVWEKMAEKMQEAAAKRSPVAKIIGSWAKSQASAYHERCRQGQTDPHFQYKLAKAVVFSKVHQALGLDRASEVSSSAAPIPLATLKYFESLDFKILEFYGATELSGPNTTNHSHIPDWHRPGTVGKVCFGVNNDIANPDQNGLGEVIVSSRNVFMGYLNDPERTKEAFDPNFWHKTGDLASRDADGFFTIHGRIKELIITSGGENIAPHPIEDELKKVMSDVVSNAILVGDAKKYLTCLITLKVEVDAKTLLPTNILTESVQNWANQRGASVKTIDDFANGPHAHHLLQELHELLAKVNEKATTRAHRVQKLSVLPQELSVPGGELGPTLKLKRFFVYDKYKDLIESMYGKRD